jgi:FtsZ-binding cell division protein ZapB
MSKGPVLYTVEDKAKIDALVAENKELIVVREALMESQTRVCTEASSYKAKIDALVAENKTLITKLKDARVRAGDFDIECPCCRGVAASGICQDGQALACKCSGHISLDTETEPWANVFEECPPEALCHPGNNPFSLHVAKDKAKIDALVAENKELRDCGRRLYERISRLCSDSLMFAGCCERLQDENKELRDEVASLSADLLAHDGQPSK